MILYHVTDVENLGSISEEGLVPRRGRLSEKLGEQCAAVFLFTSDLDCINGCMNWLGDEFDEIDEEDGYEHQHVVLECLLDDDMFSEEELDFYEVSVFTTIPPSRIRISRNPDLLVDMEYGDDFVGRYPALAEFDVPSVE